MADDDLPDLARPSKQPSEVPPGPEAPEPASFGGRDLIGLGSLVAGAVIGGLLVGLLIDRQAGTEPAFALVGIGVGIAGGVFGFWARVRRALRG
jgi:Putative F0F1-ATPase subunit Ca2+/Mg2+ transporter